MYQEGAIGSTSEIKSTELSRIQSEWISINERTKDLTFGIKESLNKIKPDLDPKTEGNPAKLNSIQEKGIVYSFNEQLRFAQENADRLQIILSHLHDLI